MQQVKRQSFTVEPMRGFRSLVVILMDVLDAELLGQQSALSRLARKRPADHGDDHRFFLHVLDSLLLVLWSGCVSGAVVLLGFL